jgi:serine protease Do
MNDSDLHIRRWVATLVVLAAIAGGVLLTVGVRDWSGGAVYGAPNLDGLRIARDNGPIPLGSFANGFASVLRPALPAVVNVHSSKVVKQKGFEMPFFNDPFFQQFFGKQFGQTQPEPEREMSLGSGVIVTADGTILTNNHVITGASEIKVTLSDKRTFTAKLVGSDPDSDVAVLKINASGLPTLAFGDSSKLEVGDVVFAIGDPFGIGETATMGIVSATSRGPAPGFRVENYQNFIQTDAAINPGNSGGALIDLHGNLIGINTAILTGGSSEGNVGIGFAIPIDMARNVMSQIVEHGKVIRGYLGLLPQDVSEAMAKQFGLSQPTGALVAEVEPNTPASRAGIKRGDIILKVNGETIGSMNDLRLKISQMAPGSTADLTVWRDNRTQDVKVTLSELPKQESAETKQGEMGGSGTMQGVEVETLTPDMTQDLGVPSGTKGVVITSVDPASRAAEAGLDRGIIIVEVNHRPVTNAQEYRQAVASAGDHSVLLLIMLPNADGATNYVVVEPH